MRLRHPALTILLALILPAGAICAAEPNLRETTTVQVVRKTKDAVVNISTTKLMARRVSPFGDDPFWQDFGQVVQVPANSLGSGFIIQKDGYVVTNHHVIDRARQINVELADGRKLPAELVSSDAEADLAILRIASDKPFPTLDLGDSSDLMIGEPVIAVGNPMGYSHSVSTGIVSAIHRDLKDRSNKVTLGDLVQTDAAINPGNSGGPLLNAYGQVIGINTAIRGDAQNIGFAIQVNRLRDLIPDLMNPAQVAKIDIALRLKETRKLSPPATVSSEVRVDAKAADLAAVTEIGGQKVSDIVDAYAALLRTKADQKELVVKLADGSETKFAVKPVPQPDALVQAKERLGVTVEALTPMLAEKLKLPAEDGLLVKEVAKNSAAGKAGLEAGDIIIQLGRYRISSLQDLSAVLQHLPAKQLRVGIIRGNQVAVGVMEL